MADPKTWDGYPEELKAQWRNQYALKKKTLLEESLPEDEAMQLAADLVEGGFTQVSRKYRRVARIKPFNGAAKTYLERLSQIRPDSAKSIRERYERLMEMEAKQVLYMMTEDREEKELDERTFDLFRMIYNEKRVF